MPNGSGVNREVPAPFYEKLAGQFRRLTHRNYHRRSMAETAFLRLKKIFGASAASRIFANQVIELTLRCHMLNKMNQLGMPDSIMI